MAQLWNICGWDLVGSQCMFTESHLQPVFPKYCGNYAQFAVLNYLISCDFRLSSPLKLRVPIEVAKHRQCWIRTESPKFHEQSKQFQVWWFGRFPICRSGGWHEDPVEMKIGESDKPSGRLSRQLGFNKLRYFIFDIESLGDHPNGISAVLSVNAQANFVNRCCCVSTSLIMKSSRKFE